MLGEELSREGYSVWDTDVLPPSRGVRVADWVPSLKHYPHFDKPIRPADIEKLVRDPEAVARNAFYPFLRFEEKWQPFRGKVSKSGGAKASKPEVKRRELRFASRRDAYIYSYYRFLLQEPYEAELLARGLSASVIAYRRLKTPLGKGKSNIDFAHDAFNAIREFGNAAVVTLDISRFFESIDHQLLREKWCILLKSPDLPPDHQAVFRAITKYAVVDRDKAYERLGYLTWKHIGSRRIPVYSKKIKEMPRQICSNFDFREKICGKGKKYTKLIEPNANDYGIPQGSPISDVLANLYLIDFDTVLNNYVRHLGGLYFRYSDDIILIIPGDDKAALEARDFAMNEITKHGSEIIIKKSKTSVLKYYLSPNGQKFLQLDGEQGKNGLEYLGFRYDGRFAYLRDATLSRLYRKVTRSIQAEAWSLVKRYPGKNQSYIEQKFSAADFMQRYGRVKDFDNRASYETWTFWTYTKRAIATFGPLGDPIGRQLRNYGIVVRARMQREIANALKK